MVIDAESVAKDCQQSQIMERLHQNRISKCTAKTNQQEKKKKTAVVCLKILQLKLAQQYS